MKQGLSVWLLGEPSIMLDGVRMAHLGSNRASALIYYLAVVQEPCNRHLIARMLWPHVDQSRAHRNFRDLLFRVRRAFGSYIESDGEQIQLVGDGLTIDIRTFRCLLQAADTTVDRIEQLDLLRQACTLYRDSFCQGYQIDDAPEFELWLLEQAECYQSLAVVALDKLVNLLLATGSMDEAYKYNQLLVKIDPWREASHRLLMRVLVEHRNRIGAIRHYHAWRNRLLSELGVEPDIETTVLYDQIATNTYEPGAKPLLEGNRLHMSISSTQVFN